VVPTLNPYIKLSFVSIAKIYSGKAHSLVSLSNGTLLAFGHNVNGELGVGDVLIRNIPTEVTTLRGIPIWKMSLGSHSLALTTTGDLYGWGLNVFGELGIGSWVSQATPAKAPVSNIIDIAAGYQHSLIVRQDGICMSCGNNNVRASLSKNLVWSTWGW
jgi:hypothetical protein